MAPNTIDPQQVWDEMIRKIGNGHGPLPPKLSASFLHDPRSLMHHVSWFKFAGKMIGQKNHVLAFDPMEGLGTWTLATETGKVTGIVDEDDSIEELQLAWPDERLVFSRNYPAQTGHSAPFNAAVRFDIYGSMQSGDWDSFFKSGKEILCSDGIIVAGGRTENLSATLEKYARHLFKHVFMFGHGQEHPCISPADTSIVLACGLKE